MESTGSPQTAWSAAVVGGGGSAAQPVAAGAASLDSSLIRQTKSEIRALASEIAQLADADIEPEEFYSGFLLRVCTAMGASAAGVWWTEKNTPVDRSESPQSGMAAPYKYALVASHCFPSELLGEPDVATRAIDEGCPGASGAHRRILDCIVAEGQPILVPPGSVKIESERPQNPLAEALIVVPLRVEAEIEYLLQVVHKPSGGPTANRGYLRFVAQMADLLSDYLRKQRLREVGKQRKQLHRLSEALREVAAEHVPNQCLGRAADAACELAEASKAMILATFGRRRVVAVSGARSFDRRSSIVEQAEQLCKQVLRSVGPLGLNQRDLWELAFELPDRRAGNKATQSAGDSKDDSDEKRCSITLNIIGADGQASCLRCVGDDSSQGIEEHHLQTVQELGTLSGLAVRLGQELGCQRLRLYPMRDDLAFLCLIGLDVAKQPRQDLGAEMRAIGGLLQPTVHLRPSERVVARLIHSGKPQGRAFAISTWVMRCALLGILIAIACFPVQESVLTSASLHPAIKQAYYAEENGVVAEVFVSDGQAVLPGEPLLKLRNPELESQYDQLIAEQEIVKQKIGDGRLRLRRGASLELAELDQIESELKQLELKKAALFEESKLVFDRLRSLQIVARSPGKVSAWDSENTLLHRPVGRGELLLGTFQPEGQWLLRLAIPSHRYGLVAKQTDSKTEPTIVEFSLSSHPEQTLHAQLIRTSQTAASPAREDGQRTLVYADAIVDTNALPLKTDGAIARASIHCGRVPAIWLVVRDAYYAVSSRIKMLW